MADNQDISDEIEANNHDKRDFRKRKFRSQNQFGKKKRRGKRKGSDGGNNSNNNHVDLAEMIGFGDDNRDGDTEDDIDNDTGILDNDIVGDISSIFGKLVNSVDESDIQDFEGVSQDFLDGIVNFVSETKKRLDRFRKIESESEEENEHFVDDSNGDTCFIETASLCDLFKKAVCEYCGCHSLVVFEEKQRRKGLTSILSIKCENESCPNFQSTQRSVYSSGKAGSSPNEHRNRSFSVGRDSGSSRLPFSVNMRLVLASRAIGVGYHQLRRFFSILGIGNFMHIKTFQELNKKLHAAAMSAVKKNLTEVREKVKNLYDNENFLMEGQEDNMNKNKFKSPPRPGDIAVMFDGTWQKRGKGLSHNGIGNTMEVNTGYLLDYEVLSNFCKGCLQAPDEDSAEFLEWKENHAPNCQKNTDVSAHNMESAAAKAIWERSVKLEPSLRYRSFLSDGDSAAFNVVTKEKPYGPDVDIVKEDCANHVAKRLGTALRKLKGLPRGHSLKEETIKKLSLYYRLAISNNIGNVEAMHRAIWASYAHSASTDDHHSHSLCPQGEDSWCNYNKAVAKGEDPPPHKPRLTKPQAEGIRQIYETLSEQKLLSRCIQGKTQNPCESLNGRIWLLCPKTRWASLKTVETAAAIAVLWYNKGYSAFTDVLDELGTEVPGALKKETVVADEKRVASMQRKGTGEQRYRRQQRELEVAMETDNRKKREGITYYSGGLDLGMFDHVAENSDIEQ